MYCCTHYPSCNSFLDLPFRGTLDDNQFVPNIFHLEDMIGVDIFSIRSAVEITQELSQVKEVFIGHLNNSNILASIQKFTALLKSRDVLFLVHHLKAI